MGKIQRVDDMNKMVANLLDRSIINMAELEMNQFPLAIDNNGFGKAELKVEHHFSPGIYTRVLYIPKGCLLTGKIHKEPILNIMIQGEISVLIGNETIRVKAPYIIVSPAGSKKMGYAHEDTIWMGCHGTDEVDIQKIEARFVAQSEEDWLDYCGQQMMQPFMNK
jgi:hypothetical protein